MRNHPKQWLKLLQWSSFLTLLSAAWLTISHHSPLGNLFKLDQKLAEYLNITDPSTTSYLMIGISLLLAISALCSFRCGAHWKLKYVTPLIISALIIIITLFLYAFSSSQHSTAITIAIFIIPVSTPLLLINYHHLKNQVDYWSVWACLLIAITTFAYAFQSLTTPIGIPTPSGIPIKMSGLTTDLNALIVTTTAYLAIATAIALFITTLRKLALYIIIILGLSITGATSISHLSSTEPLHNISLWLPMTLLITGYWLLPTLILYSLASHRKTRTLKL